MKKAFLTYTSLFALSAVVFIATVVSTGLEHTGNSFEIQNPVGDPAAAQNVQVSMSTVMSQQLHWDTTLTLGPQPHVDTHFRLTPEKETEIAEYDSSYLEVSTSHSILYSSQEILSLWQTDRPDRSPYEAVILDVCSRAPASGMPYTETVTLSDYLDFYPVYLWHSCSDPTCSYVSVDLSAVLSIPIPDDTTAEVTVTKELDGSVFLYSLYSPEIPNIQEEAVWFEDAYYVTIPAEYQALLGGEGSAMPGVYRLPLTTGANGVQSVDVEHITLEFPSSSPLQHIYLVQGGSKFLLDTPPGSDAPGQIQVVDAHTWDLVQQIPLESTSTYRIHVEDDHLVCLTGQNGQLDLTTWTLEEDHLYHPTISASIPRQNPEDFFFTVTRVNQGRLYAICNAWSSGITSFDVGVFDHSGLLYYATCVPNQSRDTWGTNNPLWLKEYPPSLTLLPA